MNISVLGAGAWGTAMALHLVRLGHTVTLVPRRFEHALELGKSRENTDYLPDHPFPESLQIGFELEPVLMETELVVLACPVVGMRDWSERVKAALGPARQLRLILTLAKGLERETYLTPCRIVKQVLPDIAVGTLTGPSHASEVAAARPTALLLATEEHSEFAERLQAALSGSGLRVYSSDDVTGAELGGALKNVYAIAAGVADGLGLGHNAKAALVTRILPEMIRIGEILGARPATFIGLSGFGDMVATCYGEWSRNYDFGLGIGRGAAAGTLLADRKTVVEGYWTTESFHALCHDRAIDAPILDQTHAILFRGRAPAEALAALMTRDLKREGAKG